MNNRVVTFGERMLRLRISGYERFVQTKLFQVNAGLDEANFAVSPVNYLISVDSISRLSENGIGDVSIVEINSAGNKFFCRRLYNRLLNVKKMIITLRNLINANHNTWSDVLWNGGKLLCLLQYDIAHIVDRVGSDDSFRGDLSRHG